MITHQLKNPFSSGNGSTVNFQGSATASGVTEDSIVSVQHYPIPATIHNEPTSEFPRKRLVSKGCFGGDSSKCHSLSGLDLLAIVAEKIVDEKYELDPATLLLEFPMAEQFPSPLPKFEKIEPKPEIPIAMVGVEENTIKLEKRNGAPSNPALPQEFKDIILSTGGTVKENAIKLGKRNGAPSNPALPQEFKDIILSMGGTDPVLVIHKKLFMSDVHKDQNRLTMPERECGKWLSLTEEERELLKVRDEKNRVVGIRVRVVDPGLKEKELTFKRWHLGKSANFVLVNNWNQIVVDNKLKEEDDFQVWTFRIQGRLSFALVKLSAEFHTKKNTKVEERSPLRLIWGVKRKRGA